MKKTIFLFAFLFATIHGFCQDEPNIQMAFVKGGNFFMGCDDKKYLGEEYQNERPLHRVNVSSFSISKYEITMGQWRSIMGVKPPAYDDIDYSNKDCDNCPVVKVSWNDVQEFIKRLNAKFPDRHYRLPTETEWEYAARGGKYSKKYKYSGGDKLSEVAWYGKSNGATHPVGQKQANELAIFDMCGNAMEWVNDWYADDYYSKTIDEINPKGPETGAKRVARGGSYFDDEAICRTTYRSRFAPTTRQWNLGFRLAMDSQ